MAHDPKTVTALKVKKLTPAELQILWADGHETRHIAASLRGQCPCASCKDEWTGERYVLPMHIPDTLEFVKIGLVGKYALHFDFSDDHHTGIYSFEYLRELCRCPECVKASMKTP